MNKFALVVKINSIKANFVLSTTITIVLSTIIVHALVSEYYFIKKFYYMQKRVNKNALSAMKLGYNLKKDFNNCAKYGVRSNDLLWSRINFKKINQISICQLKAGCYVKGFYNNELNKEKYNKTISKKIKKDTSMITFHNVSEYIGYLKSDMKTKNSLLCINVSKSKGISTSLVVGDQLVISDIYQAEKFVVSDINKDMCIGHDNFYNRTDQLSKAFNKNSKIYRVKDVSYYMGLDSSNKNKYSIFRKEHNRPSVALVDGVAKFIVDKKLNSIDSYAIRFKFFSFVKEKNYTLKQTKNQKDLFSVTLKSKYITNEL